MVHPFKDPSTLWRMVSFEHFDLVDLIRIMFYGSYHSITNIFINVQANNLSFGLVFKVVTFQFSLVFHLGFSYLKPHGLTRDQRGSLPWHLKKTCPSFHLNPMWKSKYIGLLLRVLNWVINGRKG